MVEDRMEIPPGDDARSPRLIGLHLAHVLIGEPVTTPDQVGGQAFAGTCAMPAEHALLRPCRQSGSGTGRAPPIS
jgi:hypothetical protein